jgi:Clr5 domain
MDTFNFSPLSPASSIAFLFDQQPPFQPLIQPTPVEEDIANVPESHQSLKKKWESLKPLIQRVYIEENKPFPYLARILCDEYGFIPT